MKISIPKNVKCIIDKIYENGFEAFIVGGCVRDSLLGRIPNDYDITTNATPNEVINMFKKYKIIDNGIKHGTVGVIINTEIYEITTYRIEKEYEGNRRPKEVEFTGKIEEDLKRRDFTINAIAYNDRLGIIDKFNGIDDIKNKIIKTVGNPDERFMEDGLRIMRAIRFSSQLDFKIEENTLKSVYKNANIIKNISIERINEEFTKTITSGNPQKIEILYESKIFEKLGIHKYITNYEGYKDNLAILRECSDTLRERLLMLEYIVANKEFKKKNVIREKNIIYRQYMKECSIVNILKYPKKLTDNCNLIIEYMNFDYHNLDRIEIKKILNSIGRENLEIIFKLKKIYYVNFFKNDVKNKIEMLDTYINIVNEIEENNECYSIRELEINGNDLKKLGYEGAGIGKKLNYLLDEVIKNPTLNEKSTLINILNS